MALTNSAETVTSNSVAVVAGNSAQLLGINSDRQGLNVEVDPAAIANVYLLLGTGTASAANWHVALEPGGSWDGTLSVGVLWRGAIQFFSGGSPTVGVIEV